MQAVELAVSSSTVEGIWACGVERSVVGVEPVKSLTDIGRRTGAGTVTDSTKTTGGIHSWWRVQLVGEQGIRFVQS